MQTFFAQVERAQTDDDTRDPIVLWLGGRFCERKTPESLVAELRPYADLDAAILSALHSDLAESTAIRPTPLQVRMRKAMRP